MQNTPWALCNLEFDPQVLWPVGILLGLAICDIIQLGN